MINWGSVLEIGIPAIDAQHRKLVDLYNELYSLLTAGHGREVLVPVFLRLVDLTGEHFAHEEQVMTALDYPDRYVHRREHMVLQRTLGVVADGVQARRRDLGIDLLAFLKDWLLRHIVQLDRELGEYAATRN